ncbi:two-component system, NtrC family, response regulator GlrR [Solimonas aquatica]|uniref:Two-component system, NtrC family, response regulator GlrR n=1 Tax=Solimonas aquatica TaxID=489703 RepID=A0A1H9AHU6_9GAMM|nr:sigma 54-interacting transcriptional regulator [Solimonas aquatica]SEP75538.1 two-component system, NtrC family, response regulator GlrR [Solimonas aquatica]
MNDPRILLVDDDAKLLRVLSLRLEAEGYMVSAAACGEEALRLLDQAQPQMVLTDLRMPEMDGLELMSRIQQGQPSLPIAILTAHGDIPEAVRATHAGAVDFLIKPVAREDLLACIRRHLHDCAGASANGQDGKDLISRSPLMLSLIADARRVARSDAAVLITGASGTGKEVLAKFMHQQSSRSQGPFVAINCTAVPAELLESELFGHRRGAFTGAHSDHDGLLRAAEGGTVFLDEIGDMQLNLQAKLLRVLQEREVRPVGETRAVPVDVRVISATHCDLEARVSAGEFREDLFYRLNVVRLRIPPLEQRREDIPALVAHCLTQLRERGAPPRVFSPDALGLLSTAAWPGNVRQLFNVVEQCVALAPGRVIGAALMRRCLGESGEALQPLDEARSQFTRSYLRQLLEICGGNVSRAARLARRNRTDFYKLLSRYEVDLKQYKPAHNA